MELDTTKRILVAEDNPNLRRVLVNIIRKLGFERVHEADDGMLAWKFVEAGKVDIVMADWAMPSLDGLQLLQKIRHAKEPICNVPFLMITAADTRSSIMSAGSHGVDAYVIKPFSVQTVVDKLSEAIQNRSA